MTASFPAAAPLVTALRHGRWLTRDRAVAWGGALLGAELAFLIFVALFQHGAFGPVPPTSSDFVSFYAAGSLALAGTPALAYDQPVHHLVQQQATVAGAPYQFFFYPPVYLLLCAPLALLPYFLANALFQIASLGLFLGVMRAVLAERGWDWLIPLLAFPAVLWTIGLGQNAFLTASLFGGFLLLLERRPVLAGVLVGLLCYKPHFGLLVPVALIAGGHWRAVFSAGVTVAALVAGAAAVFGLDTWQAYVTAFAGSGQVYESGRIDLAGMVTVFGALRLFGLLAAVAYGAQAISAVAMAVAVALVWRRTESRPLRAATLLTATLLAVPLALLYDQMLLLLAAGWMVRQARTDGFLPWEKAALFALYPLALLLWPVGAALYLPLGVPLSLLVLSLCLRRVWPLRAQTPTRGSRPLAVGTAR
ncbi:MAG: glycosyltransferase family 87 protein [Acetobacteraceae bacterium]